MKIIFGFILCVFIIGCASSSDDSSSLPVGASNVSNLGNGWVYFYLDGNKYLYHKESQAGGFSYESITQVLRGIPCAE